MCGGHRWRYWATGLPGWMRGGGRRWPGEGHRWHGHPAYAYGPEWAGAGAYGFGPWSGEPIAEDELTFLKSEAESLKHYLEGIERRITELERASAAHDAS
jgi:hypothetical protein